MTTVISAQLLAKSGEAVKAGPIGLAVILLLCVACYFLFKSMSKHLKTVREDFPVDPPTQKSAPAQASTPAPTTMSAPTNSSAEPPA